MPILKISFQLCHRDFFLKILDNFLLKVGKLKLSRFSEIKEEFSWQENNEKIKTESLGFPLGGFLCVCLPSKAPIILMIFVVFFS